MWEKPIYIARRKGAKADKAGNLIVGFHPPEKYYFNTQPVSGNTEILAYGERIFHMYRAMVTYDEWIGVFNEGDLAYLDGQTPEGETVPGERANYRIVSVRGQNMRIAIYFEKLQKGVQP